MTSREATRDFDHAPASSARASNSLSFEQLRDDHRQRLVYKAETWNAKHRLAGSPVPRQFAAPFRGELPRRVGLRLGDGFARWLGTVFMIAEVVDDIGDRVANEQHPFRIEQTALRVGRGKLETFKQNLLVIGEQRLRPSKTCRACSLASTGSFANIR